MPSTPSKSHLAALQDILDNIKLACGFVRGMTLKDFQADRRTNYAVVRCLEIVSEASRRLPDEIKARHLQIPWVDIAGAGNIYRHHYHVVRDELLWETVQQELEPLRIVVEEEIERLKP